MASQQKRHLCFFKCVNILKPRSDALTGLLGPDWVRLSKRKSIIRFKEVRYEQQMLLTPQN